MAAHLRVGAGLTTTSCPGITISLFVMAGLMRLTRSSMLEVQETSLSSLPASSRVPSSSSTCHCERSEAISSSEEVSSKRRDRHVAALLAMTNWVRVTARIKGLQERLVIFKHALKNAIIPVLTFGGVSFAGLLNGAIVVEVVFAWPGLGRLMLDSDTRERDTVVIMAAITDVRASSTYFLSTVVDILYAYVDPRIRYGVTETGNGGTNGDNGGNQRWALPGAR